MVDFAGTILTAAGAFTATNLDDLLVLCVLFLSARASAVPGTWRIWAGQYIGVGLLTAVAGAAAWALAPVPVQWVGLLGLVPLALGARGLLAAARHSGGSHGVAAPTLPAVIAVTVANGSDNIAVYIPLFRSLGPGGFLATAPTFAAMVAVWCTAGHWLTKHPKIVAAFSRAGHWGIPAVYMALGLTIIFRSGVLELAFRH